MSSINEPHKGQLSQKYSSWILFQKVKNNDDTTEHYMDNSGDIFKGNTLYIYVSYWTLIIYYYFCFFFTGPVSEHKFVLRLEAFTVLYNVALDFMYTTVWLMHISA